MIDARCDMIIDAQGKCLDAQDAALKAYGEIFGLHAEMRLLRHRAAHCIVSLAVVVVLLAVALVVVSIDAYAQTPGTTNGYAADWITMPDNGGALEIFKGAFWSIVNWFLPIIMPVLGLVVGTYIFIWFKRAAFEGAK